MVLVQQNFYFVSFFLSLRIPYLTLSLRYAYTPHPRRWPHLLGRSHQPTTLTQLLPLCHLQSITVCRHHFCRKLLLGNDALHPSIYFSFHLLCFLFLSLSLVNIIFLPFKARSHCSNSAATSN